jgi:hypothetical protein
LNWDEELAHLNLSYNYLKEHLMYKEKNPKRSDKPKRKNIPFFEWHEALCNVYSDWLTDYGHTFTFTLVSEDSLSIFKDSIKKSDDKNKPQYKSFDLVLITDYLPSYKRAGAIDAVDMARELLNLKKDQRLLFALFDPSRFYVKFLTVLQSIPVIIHKSFTKEEFLHLVEDDYMYYIASDISQKITSIKNIDDDEKSVHRSCSHVMIFYNMLKYHACGIILV